MLWLHSTSVVLLRVIFFSEIVVVSEKMTAIHLGTVLILPQQFYQKITAEIILKYSQTCFERPLVFTMVNGRKSRVTAQSKVDYFCSLFPNLVVNAIQ